MRIDLPSDLLARIEARAERYGIEPVDVIREALDALDFYEEDELTEEELQASLAALDQGMDDVRSGRTTSLAEAVESIRREAGL